MSNGKVATGLPAPRSRAKYALWALAIAASAGLSWWLLATKPAGPHDFRVTLSDREYLLELADSPGERAKGLSGRDSLCERCGMLFVFPEAGIYSFWMRDTHFPLDILWLREESIVWIERAAAPDTDRLIRPEAAADRVIEVPAGAADAYAPGDFLRLEAR